MNIENYIEKYELWIIVIIIIFFITIIVFIVISIISWQKGCDIKFLWFEIKNNKKENKMDKNELSKPIINAKNVNTGTNYGNIGDVYTGIQQRHLTNADKKQLLNELQDFIKKYDDKINKSHITIGYPGDKESNIFANEVVQFMYEQGYRKIEKCILMTYGSIGKKIGVSNAPDDTVMIEIFQSDNI
jgi:hypothetical protein